MHDQKEAKELMDEHDDVKKRVENFVQDGIVDYIKDVKIIVWSNIPLCLKALLTNLKVKSYTFWCFDAYTFCYHWIYNTSKFGKI